MKIAMYKGPAKDIAHKISHWITCLRTMSVYSHCEIVFSEPRGDGTSLCASSSLRDGGIRFKQIDLDSGNWDVYVISGYDEEYAKAWFEARKGMPYDIWGLLWFLLPIRKFNNPNSYFCSEACAAALKIDSPHKLHPQSFLDAVRR